MLGALKKLFRSGENEEPATHPLGETESNPLTASLDMLFQELQRKKRRSIVGLARDKQSLGEARDFCWRRNVRVHTYEVPVRLYESPEQLFSDPAFQNAWRSHLDTSKTETITVFLIAPAERTDEEHFQSFSEGFLNWMATDAEMGTRIQHQIVVE